MGRTEDERLHAGMLAAVLRLFSRWSSLDVQRAVARQAGLAIEPTDVRAVYALGLHGGAMRPSALAEELQLTRPTASKMLARLDAAGLAARADDPDDGRASLIGLSRDGADAFARLYAAGIAMMRESVRAWTPEERGVFAAQLDRFVEAVMPPNDDSARIGSADLT